VSSKEL